MRQPSNARHRHTYFEICLVAAGTGRFWHGGAEFPLRKGDVFVADPDVVHEISSYATRDLHVEFLSFTATASEGEDDESRLVCSFLADHTIVGKPSYDLARWLPLLAPEVPSAPSAKRLFLLEMLRLLCNESRTSPSESRAPNSDLRAASALIDANLHRPIRAKEVADAAGISDRTLRRRFEAVYGQGVAAEILERRINAAAHRLLMGFPVAEVAASVGLDPAPFARAFRAARGLPPKRFQKEYRPPAGRTTG